MQTLNTGVVSSIPPCVTFKTPLMRTATVNHLMNSTFPEKLRALSLVSAALEIETAMQLVDNNIFKTDKKFVEHVNHCCLLSLLLLLLLQSFLSISL